MNHEAFLEVHTLLKRSGLIPSLEHLIRLQRTAKRLQDASTQYCYPQKFTIPLAAAEGAKKVATTAKEEVLDRQKDYVIQQAIRRFQVLLKDEKQGQETMADSIGTDHEYMLQYLIDYAEAFRGKLFKLHKAFMEANSMVILSNENRCPNIDKLIRLFSSANFDWLDIVSQLPAHAVENINKLYSASDGGKALTNFMNATFQPVEIYGFWDGENRAGVSLTQEMYERAIALLPIIKKIGLDDPRKRAGSLLRSSSPLQNSYLIKAKALCAELFPEKMRPGIKAALDSNAEHMWTIVKLIVGDDRSRVELNPLGILANGEGYFKKSLKDPYHTAFQEINTALSVVAVAAASAAGSAAAVAAQAETAAPRPPTGDGVAAAQKAAKARLEAAAVAKEPAAENAVTVAARDPQAAAPPVKAEALSYALDDLHGGAAAAAGEASAAAPKPPTGDGAAAAAQKAAAQDAAKARLEASAAPPHTPVEQQSCWCISCLPDWLCGTNGASYDDPDLVQPLLDGVQ